MTTTSLETGKNMFSFDLNALRRFLHLRQILVDFELYTLHIVSQTWLKQKADYAN